MKLLSLTIPGGANGSITVLTPPNIPSGSDAPGHVINFILVALVTTGIIASLIFTLYGGILWITSQGDKGKLERARRTITFAIIGLIIITLSFTIVRIVGTILGASAVQNLAK